MALSDSKVYDIYEELKYKFLFNNDINCMHILLNLYELENNINNIFPKYISIRRLRKNIRKALNDRRGNHLIAYNLGELIHEDINKLELLIYLEAYKAGYLNKKHVNILENITLKYFSISNLYNMRYLFNFDTSISEVNNFKLDIYESLLQEEKTQNILKGTITSYTENILKPKVLSLNKYLDKQLSIEYQSKPPYFRDEESILTLEELKVVYKEVVKIITINANKLYNHAYWNGLNDRLISRYK
ncbi:hypothetical protein [Tissierella creatinophila]|uniref:Uncharacterized protein n=1 Tax=Tissierella creatinophila DSM 6911 TaxID=1123403 RepID=A0A1U7M2W3_TISCR|nr:hypothetical protein [Tissierella creatinophila]OLS01662.1 hypothetical protein TICRE_22620 [Tissierella creatinophila DSM 6911]